MAGLTMLSLLLLVTFGSAMELPKLPEVFSTRVEANIVNKNYTMVQHEWVDEPNNIGRVDFFTINSTTGISSHSSAFYFYDIDEYAFIDDDGNCSAGPLEDLGRRLPFAGTTGPNATIGTTADFFRFGQEMNETYMGTETVRGILCNHWLAVRTISFNLTNATTNVTIPMSINMTLDWYFAHPDWDKPNSGDFQAPVRLKLQGMGRDGPYLHYYDYVTFSSVLHTHHGDTASIFQLPCDSQCVGNYTIEPPSRCPSPAPKPWPQLPSLPDVFSASIQATIVNKNYTLLSHEWVDEPNNLARIDSIRLGQDGAEDTYSSMIYYYNNDQYARVNDSGCFQGMLDELARSPAGLPFGGSAGDDSAIGSSAEIFRFGSAYNETYYGTASIRGILCNLWKSEVPAGPGMTLSLEWYFSHPSWHLPGAGKGAQVPVRLVVRGPSFSGGMFEHFYDYIHFETKLTHSRPGMPSHGNADDIFKVMCGTTCQGSTPQNTPTQDCPTTPTPKPIVPSECPTSAPSPTETGSEGASTGAVVGAGIGCLLLGVAIGIYAHIFHQARKAVSYNTYKDDNVDSNL